MGHLPAHHRRPKVAQPYAEVLVDEDVFVFDVAVRDVVVRKVRDRLDHLPHDVSRGGLGEGGMRLDAFKEIVRRSAQHGHSLHGSLQILCLRVLGRWRRGERPWRAVQFRDQVEEVAVGKVLHHAHHIPVRDLREDVDFCRDLAVHRVHGPSVLGDLGAVDEFDCDLLAVASSFGRKDKAKATASELLPDQSVAQGEDGMQRVPA